MNLFSRWRQAIATQPRGLQALLARNSHVPLEDCACRSRVQVAGEVIAVTPRPDPVSFTATLSDGSATIDLVWPGRKEIPGIRVGTFLVARGTVGTASNGQRILDPEYSIEVPE